MADAKKVASITFTLLEDGQVQASGNINDLLFALGFIEAGKIGLIEHHKQLQQNGGVQVATRLPPKL